MSIVGPGVPLDINSKIIFLGNLAVPFLFRSFDFSLWTSF